MDISIIAQEFYEYSSYIRGYSKDTIRRYKYVISFYCRYAEIKSINEISNENVRSLFFYGRTQRHWQANTYIVFYKSLKVFFKWCITKGLMEQNPTVGIELPKLEKRVPKRLSKQDALRLLDIVYNYPYGYDFLRHRNHAIYSTFMFAGLRKQELLNLKLTDVDLENLSIFINQGKGNKDRILPISFTLAQSLKRYLEQRKRLKKNCPAFFTSLNRNMGFTDKGLNNLTRKIREASGIQFSVHRLRHTFATLMIEGGCDIYNLSNMLGHSDIKTTTIYLSATVEHLRIQITKHPLNN